jgi:transcriptional regulator with XRE-family HTH domain
VAERGEARDWLSRTLRELRRDAGLSGVKAAAAAGISQSRISRIEGGRFVPTEEEIWALCRLYRAPTATRRQLVQAVRDMRAEVSPARVVLQHGAWRMQQRVARIEASAAEVCVYQPAIIPGLLQTSDYARLVFADGGAITGADLDQAVAARQARSAVLGSGTEFTLIMAEGALRWQAGSPQIMADQLGHITDVIDSAGVQIGIVPQVRRATVFTLHGFSVYDKRTVIIGTRAGTAFITDPRDVAEYVELFAELTALASFGADAREILGRIAGEYSAMT